MQTINGKLINMERGQLDIVRRQTSEISKCCEGLQQQLNGLKQDNEDRDAVCLKEIATIKSYLVLVDKKLNAVGELTTIKAHAVMLNKKLATVEEVAAKQAKSLTIVKFYSFWSLALMSCLLAMSIQANWHKEQPQKDAEVSINYVRFGA